MYVSCCAILEERLLADSLDFFIDAVIYQVFAELLFSKCQVTGKNSAMINPSPFHFTSFRVLDDELILCTVAVCFSGGRYHMNHAITCYYIVSLPVRLKCNLTDGYKLPKFNFLKL